MNLITNINEQESLQEALQERECFIQRVAEAIPGIIYIYDLAEARNIYINHQVSKILGYTPEQMQTFGSQVLQKLVHPDDFINILAAHQQIPTISDGEVIEIEYRMRHANGEWRWLLSRDTVFLRNPDGSPKQLLGTAQDITDRKQTEEVLQAVNQELEIRVQQRTHELSNAINLLSFAHSQLRQELVQRKQAEETTKQQAEWERLLGKIVNHIRQSLDFNRILTTTVTELQQLLQADRVLVFRLCPDGVGRTIAEAVAPGQLSIKEQQFPDQIFSGECYELYRQGNIRIIPDIENDEVGTCLIEFFQQLGVKSKLVVPLLQDASVWGVLSVHYCKGLPRQWQEWEISCLQRLASQVAIAIQQAELYEQVQKALAQEKELNELKSHFVSMASHEFRTPLSTILSSADLLEYYVQEGCAQKTLEHIQRIQIACLNMTELLNDILVIGSAQAGKVDFNPSTLDLVDFCDDLVEEMQLTVDRKHNLLFVSQSQNMLACMDEKLLWHILTNLLSNAIKYSPDGGNVQLKIFDGDGVAVLQIQDQGIGIPKEDQVHLFESFHRAKNVGNIIGTGLGLAIVKRSVELHGGQIAIASEVGVGTTVTVTLPLNSSNQTNEENTSD